MKTVYSNAQELAHVWAQGNFEPHIKASAVTAEYGRFFSYNTCIAELHKNGTHVVINTHSYTPMTTKHQNAVRMAIHSVTAICLDIPYTNLRGLIMQQDEFDLKIVQPNTAKITDLVDKASRARKNGDAYRREALDILFNVQAYAQLMGLEFTAGDLGIIYIAQQHTAVKKALTDAQRVRAAETLLAWRNGAISTRNSEVTALRVEGDYITTTKGAKVPLQEAVNAYPLLMRLAQADDAEMIIKHMVKTGKPLMFGVYKLLAITPEVMTVGCHKIPMAEIHAMAKQLGVASCN